MAARGGRGQGKQTRSTPRYAQAHRERRAALALGGPVLEPDAERARPWRRREPARRGSSGGYLLPLTIALKRHSATRRKGRPVCRGLLTTTISRARGKRHLHHTRRRAGPTPRSRRIPRSQPWGSCLDGSTRPSVGVSGQNYRRSYAESLGLPHSSASTGSAFLVKADIPSSSSPRSSRSRSSIASSTYWGTVRSRFAAARRRRRRTSGMTSTLIRGRLAADSNRRAMSSHLPPERTPATTRRA